MLFCWNSQNTRAERNAISVCTSRVSQCNGNLWQCCWSYKPYLLTVALPFGSLIWNGATELLLCPKKTFVCLIQLLFEYKSAFPKHAHKSSLAFFLASSVCCGWAVQRFHCFSCCLHNLLDFLPFASHQTDDLHILVQALTGERSSRLCLNKKNKK